MTTKAVVGFRRICVAALASALVIFAGAAGGSASSSGSKPKVVPDSALSGIILQISDVPNGLEPISEATGPVALGKLYTGKRARKLVGLGYRSGRETGFATPESVVRGTTAVDQLPHGVLHLFSIGTTFRDAAGASAALALERKWLIAIFRGMGRHDDDAAPRVGVRPGRVGTEDLSQAVRGLQRPVQLADQQRGHRDNCLRSGVGGRPKSVARANGPRASQGRGLLNVYSNRPGSAQRRGTAGQGSFVHLGVRSRDSR